MDFGGISNNRLRLSGLATGLDTDQIIKDLMSVERVPLDKLSQKRQVSEWKRDEYRGITNLLRGLKDEYFNLLKPGSCMLSKSTFKKSTTSSTEGVSAVASSEAIPGVYKITVDKLATNANVTSSTGVTAPMTGTAVSNYNLAGQKIKITVDGVAKEITLGNYTPDTDEIVTAPDGLQSLVNSAFGANKITVSYDAGRINFLSTSGTNKITVSQSLENSALSSLGFQNGETNRINISASLDAMKDRFSTPLVFETFTDAAGKSVEGISFNINGKTFSYDKTASVSSVINAVNSDQTAGVTMIYNEITDKFTLTAKQGGAGDNIIIDSASQKGNFFGAGGAASINAGVAAANGEDAQIRLGDDPTVITRSSNNFTINGVSYTLLKESTAQQTVTVSRDTEGIFNSIKSFVDKYNEVIDKINNELSEKYDRNYQPLTSAQKEGLSEEEIKKWEEKATTGLLRNDPLLQSIVSSMRTALLDKVEGTGLSLTDIGITTGTYITKGKLIIDEIKLKEAINTKSEDVMNLFGSSSSKVTGNIDLTSEQRATRYKENGIAYRLFDIVEDNIRTYRDKDNRKGKLLEKAGIQGDLSEFKNTIYDEITDFDTRIYSLQQKLLDKENSYYKKYAALEKAISNMNNQSSWLASQFGQNQ